MDAQPSVSPNSSATSQELNPPTRISTRERIPTQKFEQRDLLRRTAQARSRQKRKPAPKPAPKPPALPPSPPADLPVALPTFTATANATVGEPTAAEDNPEAEIDLDDSMAENAPPESSSEASTEGPGKAYHDRETANLQALLRKKVLIEQKLQRTEDTIYQKEGEYLESTPNGNIIVGFENYTKGTGAGVTATRRRGPANEFNRVFSQSSITWNQNAESPPPSASSTPVQTAPTPVASSFLKGDSASNHATPASASSMSRTGAGVKKNKKVAGDDSETDTREVKKARPGPAARK